MNLVGKIFVVVLFVMSLVFPAFAVCVYGTHKSWKAAIYREDDKDPEQGGYAQQLKFQKARNVTLKHERDAAEDKTFAVQAQYTQLVAKLEAEKARLATVNDALYFDKVSAADKNTVYMAVVVGSQQNLEKIVNELNLLRESITGTQNDRDQQFERVVVLTDAIHELLAQHDILAETNTELVAEVTRYKDVFKERGISLPPVGGRLDDIDVKGVVLAVGREDLLEISIGSDDGVRQGLQLHVYRNSKYLGVAKVLRTTPDKSVVRVDKDSLQGPIQIGDHVASKI